jgi:transcriptional regulator with XRE-family HTH domain
MKTCRVPPRPPTPAELLRLTAGFRRPYLASTAGICSETLKRLERGLTWGKPETLERIAEALGVDPEIYALAVFQTWRHAQSQKRAA